MVIWLPTMRISFGPKRKSPKEMPKAPITITHIGIETLASNPPNSEAWTIAARGPTALATSLAPWAKLSSAAEKTSGRPNNTLTDLLRFSIPIDARRMTG